MKWIEAKVEFDCTETEAETAADVIAGVFYDLGLKGVVIDDPGLVPVDDWGEAPVELPEYPAVTGFLPVSSEGLARCNNLQLQLKNVGERHNIVTHLRLREIDDEDWAESWKAFFQPVWISGDMVIKTLLGNCFSQTGYDRYRHRSGHGFWHRRAPDNHIEPATDS
jgi:ribosomal protein L11 methyltransferase